MSTILINADGETIIDPSEYPDKQLFEGRIVQIDIGANKATNETLSAGTLTFEAKGPGALGFSTIADADSIDISAPSPLRIIDSAVGALKCTASGVNATGDKIQIIITSFS